MPQYRDMCTDPRKSFAESKSQGTNMSIDNGSFIKRVSINDISVDQKQLLAEEFSPDDLMEMAMQKIKERKVSEVNDILLVLEKVRCFTVVFTRK